MLHEFITTHRERIIERARASVALRLAPRPSPDELVRGVPLFLTQLVELLQPNPGTTSETMARNATERGTDLLNMGCTVAQVVYDYGEICQAITSLATEVGAAITVNEFRALNQSLDDAIARAVTAYARQRDLLIARAEGERMSAFAHELRHLLSTASLSYELLKRGTVGTSGSTGALLGQSLAGLRDLVDGKLAVARLDGGPLTLQRLLVAGLIEEIEIGATLEARERGVHLVIGGVDRTLAVVADRQLLAAAIGNLLTNALQLTAPGGEIKLLTSATEQLVSIAVSDGCSQLDRRTGETPLAISRRAVDANGGTLRMQQTPGRGCVFTIDLPRLPPPS